MVQKRIVEIDYLRVAAIFLMVVFHFGYDLNEFAGMDVDYTSLPWYAIGKAAALLFIFVSGISCCLGRRTFKRGLTVFGLGMVITIATWLFAPREYIRFGILHFLGVSMLLSVLLKKLGKPELTMIAAVAALLGYFAEKATVITFFLVPFGFLYNGFVSMDYYPLFPYLSVFILGILAYKIFYQKGKRILGSLRGVRWICFLSRHSLFVYMVHQPILVGLIFLFRFILD